MKGIFTSLIVLLIPMLLLAEDAKCNKRQLTKPMILSGNTFDGNRIKCDILNNGQFVTHLISGRFGLEWPKGNGTGTVYASGAWYGGIINGEVRVSAAEFSGEFASGPWGDNHNSEYNKIYKINRSDLGYPQNNPDFQNWPVDVGAPWVDNNNNGKYEPMPNGPDCPEFIGDQVLWMVMNDGADSLHSVFQTEALGLEVQRTIFGFDRADAYGDIMFIKDIIINKGGNTIDSMYVGLWSDPDIGDAHDDFVGCDTSLNMGICYNEIQDINWFGYMPPDPVVGYDLFQGPIVATIGEMASTFGKDVPGYKNLNMISFIAYT